MSPSHAPLSTSEIVALLAGAMEAIRCEYSRLPRRVLAFRPAPGEWCILEVLGHLIETEQRGFAGRIRLIVEQDGHGPLGWHESPLPAPGKSIGPLRGTLRAADPTRRHGP